jgi:sulfur relay (sulfurtransferase) complex TusBCD TusD component (DsrE family)
MEYLLVLNDSLYGSQRTYNALRLAGALAKGATREVSIFFGRRGQRIAEAVPGKCVL